MGSYVDFPGLRKLSRLEYLYLGPGASVVSLSPIPELRTLRVLYLEHFRKISDYCPLAQLSSLEQLVISGPALGDITIDSLDFVCDMPNLRSIWLPNTVLLHTSAERELLRSTGITGFLTSSGGIADFLHFPLDKSEIHAIIIKYFRHNQTWGSSRVAKGDRL